MPFFITEGSFGAFFRKPAAALGPCRAGICINEGGRIMQTFKQRNQRVIVSVVMTIMMVLAMVPAMAFAAEGYTGEVYITTDLGSPLAQGEKITMEAYDSVTPSTDYHIDWSLEGCDSSVATISRHTGELTAVGGGTGTVKATLRLGKAEAGTGGQTPCTGEILATDTMTFSVASNTAYGFQGISGNTVKLASPSEQDIKVIQLPAANGNTRYLNSINTAAIKTDATGKYYQFGYQLSAGFNRFDENTFNGYADQIKVYHADAAKPDQIGAVAAGVNFDRFENGVAYINFDKASIPAGNYILRFGPNVCGNNPAKKLGINVDFMFTIK